MLVLRSREPNLVRRLSTAVLQPVSCSLLTRMLRNLSMVKYQVRPGITGWAQVNGYRGDTSIEERVKHDLWYIENWSLGLDIAILFRTAFGGMINQEKVG